MASLTQRPALVRCNFLSGQANLPNVSASGWQGGGLSASGRDTQYRDYCVGDGGHDAANADVCRSMTPGETWATAYPARSGIPEFWDMSPTDALRAAIVEITKSWEVLSLILFKERLCEI